MSPRKISLAVAITAVLSTGSAFAAQVASGYTFTAAGAVSNFTALTPDGTGLYAPYNGYTFGGTNDVTFTWDGTFFNSSSDYTGLSSVSNATISSPTLFLSKLWTAHTVQIFGPGTYSFDTALANGGPVTESGNLTMTVGANQIGAHILFDWNNNLSIDMVNVWNLNSTFSNCGAALTNPAAQNCLWTGPTNIAGNNANTVFALASTDNNGDGTLGIPMVAGGPFFDTLYGSFNFNFNLQGVSAVPIPAAAWLFGSGLLGLLGLARRKQR